MTLYESKRKKYLIELDMDFFLQSINHCLDIDNRILKGHLVIENSINNFINKQSLAKIDISQSRFSFIDKIEISKILGLFKYNKRLYDTLFALNRLRNSIAHNLVFDKDKLRDFLNTTDPSSNHRTSILKKMGSSLNLLKDDEFKRDLITITICFTIIYVKIAEASARIYKKNHPLKTPKKE